MDLQAIETQYAGYRFRSRLEARWAVFFNTLDLKWRYEPEGFVLPSRRWYLPDFLIDGIGYIEVKPFKGQDDGKMQEFAEATGAAAGVSEVKCYLLVGEIPDPRSVSECAGWRSEAEGSLENIEDPGAPYWFCICPKCEAVGIAYQGRIPRMSCPCMQLYAKQTRPIAADWDRVWNQNTMRLLVACTAARGERFEP